MLSESFLVLVTALLGGGIQGSPAPASAAPAAPATPGHSATADKTVRVAARLGADEVVSQVQAFYVDTKQLTAIFRQTYTNSTFGRESVSDGKLWIKKPGKMRWDYQGKKRKVKKSFVSDGATLWAVEHDNKQIFKQDLQDNMLPVAVTFLYGKGDLARDFTAKLDGSGKYGQKDDYVVELTPRKPSAQYKKLFLVVASDNYRVKQSIVVEASGNINHFRFYSPNTKKSVLDKWFVVTPGKLKGYRVVEPSDVKPAAGKTR